MKRIEIDFHPADAAKPMDGCPEPGADCWCRTYGGAWVRPSHSDFRENDGFFYAAADALPRYRYEPEAGDECEALFEGGWRKMRILGDWRMPNGWSPGDSIAAQVTDEGLWPGLEYPTAYRPIANITTVNGAIWAGEEQPAQPEPKPGDTRPRHSMVPDPSYKPETDELCWVLHPALKDWFCAYCQQAEICHYLPASTPQLAEPYDWDAHGWPMKEPAAEPGAERGMPRFKGAAEIQLHIEFLYQSIEHHVNNMSDSAEYKKPGDVARYAEIAAGHARRIAELESALATLAD